MEIKMTGNGDFSDHLRRIEANVKAFGQGLQVEVDGDDTADTLTDKIDQMLPYPGIDQSRGIAASYAAELIQRRDDHHREQGSTG